MGLDLSLPLDDRWLPKSVLCLRDYNLNKFSKDVIAGITVGLVALPLAMAFAIAGFFADQETIIEDADCIATSYPGFDEQLQSFLTPDENSPTPVINPAEILERN